jgi:hypothetical protein
MLSVVYDFVNSSKRESLANCFHTYVKSRDPPTKTALARACTHKRRRRRKGALSETKIRARFFVLCNLRVVCARQVAYNTHTHYSLVPISLDYTASSAWHSVRGLWKRYVMYMRARERESQRTHSRTLLRRLSAKLNIALMRLRLANATHTQNTRLPPVLLSISAW